VLVFTLLKAGAKKKILSSDACVLLPAAFAFLPRLQKAVKSQEDGLLQAMHAAGNAIKGASKDALKSAREHMRAQVDKMFPA